MWAEMKSTSAVIRMEGKGNVEIKPFSSPSVTFTELIWSPAKMAPLRLLASLDMANVSFLLSARRPNRGGSLPPNLLFHSGRGSQGGLNMGEKLLNFIPEHYFVSSCFINSKPKAAFLSCQKNLSKVESPFWGTTVERWRNPCLALKPERRTQPRRRETGIVRSE